MAVWDVIKQYQRAAWTRQAVLMDAIGVPASFGASSSTDNGLASHNLSATVTDSLGLQWTATSVGSVPSSNSNLSVREIVTGTLTCSGPVDYVLVIRPQDPTLTGSGGKQMAD